MSMASLTELMGWLLAAVMISPFRKPIISGRFEYLPETANEMKMVCKAFIGAFIDVSAIRLSIETTG
jgi:hypothetical protein